jgi:hypothetical protein
MGCIFFELMFHRKAFSGDMAVLNYALSGEAPEILSALDLGQNTEGIESTPKQALRTLIYAMLDLSPPDRPSAQHLYDIFSNDCDRVVQTVASAKNLNEAREGLLAFVNAESFQNVSDCAVTLAEALDLQKDCATPATPSAETSLRSDSLKVVSAVRVTGTFRILLVQV